MPMIKSELVQHIATQNPHLYQRDVENIDELLKFVDRRDSAKPFMGYMFFESTHANYDFPPDGVIATELVNTRELWFVCVNNPDGYEYTFTPGNRLWRKNMADNDGNGVRDTRSRSTPTAGCSTIGPGHSSRHSLVARWSRSKLARCGQ